MKVIWQLPQNLLGRVIKKIVKAEYRCNYKDAVVYSCGLRNGLSLGKYIFVPHKADEDYIKHEYGHTVQSKYLGWFYLLAIGLPSAIWSGCCKAYRKKYNVSYYDFYTEKWADKLGGVERSRQ